MKKIVVITYAYPCFATPTRAPFIKELVDKWRSNDLTVEVINPLTFKNFCLNKKNKKKNEYEKHPLYFDFRLLKFFPKLRFFLNDLSFYYAVKKNIHVDSDTILYSHFLNAGMCAARLSKKYGVSSYCAFGESTLWSILGRNIKKVRNLLKYISGFIAVSSENKDILLENHITTKEKIAVFPNGIDCKKFYPHDKKKCRERFGFSNDSIIGIFVGSFIERKGPLRVEKAAKNIPNLKMIYIGKGEQVPKDDNIIFIGSINHDLIPEYLSASDFFILPTLAEGCCNAIVEAMASGLPIISSNDYFNDDILKDDYSIRINPNDINEIRDAIMTICNDKSKRKKMSEFAASYGKKYDIEVRAIKIAKYIGIDI